MFHTELAFFKWTLKSNGENMDNQEIQDFNKRVKKNLHDATLWTKLWSLVHHSFLFGGAVLSAAAAVVLELDVSILEVPATNMATLLAVAAALTTTIAGSGGFDRKWRTNRLIKVRLVQLSIDLMNTEVKSANIRQDLKDIAQLRYDGIIGSETPPRTN